MKAMVDNVIPFFYPGESSSEACTTQMLYSLPMRSQEIILANMRQPVSLTLANNEDALKPIEDSVVTVGQVVDMLGVDMSLA
jgi:hypothetical protein